MEGAGPTWAAALALCVALNALIPSPATTGAAPAIAPENAVETAALFSLGMRRLAADLELVRLFLYYGTPEDGAAGWGEHDFGGGHYRELGSRARRILELDPGLTYAVQWTAGALAFNIGRPDEALDLVALATQKDPKNTVLRSYAAAIGMSKKGDPRRALTLLEPALADPDCPTMIKNMAAFMYRRLGEKKRAAELYRDILATSRDWGYRSMARRGLDRLGEP